MIKGKEKEKQVSNLPARKYVGFTSVEIKAINPSREELNKLLGKEAAEDDKEFTYLTQDQEGNDKLNLKFWMYDEKLNKYFVHSFNMTNKVRKNKDATKTQYINSTCGTSWTDEKGELMDWFKVFSNKEKEILGKKEYREALMGEEELVNLLRTWLGRMTWSDPSCSVLVDTKKLFSEDYSELRGLIDSDFVSPFVVLLGVRTDESDSTKQYQQVWGKSFLPNGFMNYINKNFKFPSDYSRKMWDKFETEVEGEYGFKAYFELVPATEYDTTKDVAVVPGAKEVTPVDSKF